MEIQQYLSFVKKSEAVYQKFCQGVIRDWDLNPTAFQVVMFVANNPQFNTARDLCRIRGIKTGIASVAIEQLIQTGLLERRTDLSDRRIQRLYVTPAAEKLVEQGRAVQKEFMDSVSSALSREEKEFYFRLNEKVMRRIEELEREL